MSFNISGNWDECSVEQPCGKCNELIYKYERYFLTRHKGGNLCGDCAAKMLASRDAWRGDPTTKYQGVRIRKIQAKLGLKIEVPKTKGKASDMLGDLIDREKAFDRR